MREELEETNKALMGNQNIKIGGGGIVLSWKFVVCSADTLRKGVWTICKGLRVAGQIVPC